MSYIWCHGFLSTMFQVIAGCLMAPSHYLTLKWLGHFFFQNVISFSDAVHLMCNIFIWNWSNTMNAYSALWILMAWCFSTRASVATVLTTHPCVSRGLRVNVDLSSMGSCSMHLWSISQIILKSSNCVGNYTLTIKARSPRAQWVKYVTCACTFIYLLISSQVNLSINIFSWPEYSHTYPKT